MDFHPPPSRHVAVAFLLHPESILSLEQVGIQRGFGCSSTDEQVHIETLVHTPVPPPPKILLVKNSIESIPEIDGLWGALMKPVDITCDRPFLVAVKAVSEITGLPYSSFRLVRSSAAWTVGEFDDVDKARVKSPEAGKLDERDVCSNLVKHPVIDIFHSPFEPEQLPAKSELIYYPFLFQALDLDAFEVSSHLWVAPKELEVQKDVLCNEPVAKDLSLVFSTVYISPLFNRLFALIQQNRDLGTSALHKAIANQFQRLIFDAWRVNCWIVKEPDSQQPEDCDELNLGAPYLSELKPRTVLVHLKSVLTHLSRVRPTMSVINGLVRYVFHFLQQGSKYLDQYLFEKEIKKLISHKQQQQQPPPQSISLFKRLSSIWSKTPEALETPDTEVYDEEKIDWQKFGSFEGSKPPPQSLYDKCIGRALFAVIRYQLFMDKMFQGCVSHAIHVLDHTTRVLVIGGSSLVEQVVCGFDKIVVCEGRPNFEGVKLAERLASRYKKSSVYVISEAQIGLYINHVDCCLVGAETILPDGSFVNRIGTYLLALAAINATISRNRIRSVPFFVVAPTAKIMLKETLDSLSAAQAEDALLLVPVQHPRALRIRPDEYAWKVFPPELVSKGIDPDFFLGSREEEAQEVRGSERGDIGEFDTAASKWNIDEICELGQVRCHRIDPKAAFGIVLEGRETVELTKAWGGYDLKWPANVLPGNIYTETIPAHLVSGYITERGLLSPLEVADRAQEFIGMIEEFIKKEYPTWEF